MNAIEFVKMFGLDLAKRDVAALHGGFIKREDFLEHYGFDILDDLKQIVEAFELVENVGGLKFAKDKIEINAVWCDDGRIFLNTLKQAIELVEQCN